SRRAVKTALVATRASATRPAALGSMFGVLRQPLPGPLPPHGARESTPAIEPKRTVEEAVAAAATRLAATQAPSGAWHEDYASIPFFLDVYVITCYAVGAMPDKQTCARMEQYLRTHQNPDGGWGLDVE